MLLSLAELVADLYGYVENKNPLILGDIFSTSFTRLQIDLIVYLRHTN